MPSEENSVTYREMNVRSFHVRGNKYSLLTA